MILFCFYIKYTYFLGSILISTVGIYFYQIKCVHTYLQIAARTASIALGQIQVTYGDSDRINFNSLNFPVAIELRKFRRRYSFGIIVVQYDPSTATARRTIHKIDGSHKGRLRQAHENMRICSRINGDRHLITFRPQMGQILVHDSAVPQQAIADV